MLALDQRGDGFFQIVHTADYTICDREATMGANIWFWLIYVLVGVFGIFGISPWSGDRLGSWGPFGSWLVLFILTGILGLSVYGSPIR